MTNTLKRLLVAVPATILALGCSVANAGKTIEQAGVIVCVTDKWDEKEPEKGHKLVDYTGRCVKVPDDSAEAKSTEACSGKYEYTPDGSWKASGSCAVTIVGGDTIDITWDRISRRTPTRRRAARASSRASAAAAPTNTIN